MTTPKTAYDSDIYNVNVRLKHRELSGVFHHLTVATRSTKLRPRHAFISLFGVNLCILVYKNLPESDSGCFCGNRLVYQPVFYAVVYR